jgi:ABC-2 type transport system permease protein
MRTWAVIRREYLERVRTKGFIIGTVLGPLLMSAVVVVPALVAGSRIGEQRTVGVIDASGSVLEPLRARLADSGKEKGRDASRYTLMPVSLDGRTFEVGVAELKRMVQEESVHSGLVIAADFRASRSATFYVKSVAAMGVKDDLRPALNEVLRAGRFQEKGIPEELRDYLAAGTEWTILNIGGEGQESRAGDESAFAVAIILIMMIYMMVLMYGAHTLQAVIEEKSNRVVEVLLSSMSPGSLMLGKVLGIGAAGLTQTAIWTAAFFVVSQQGVSIGSFKLDTSFLTPIIWISFLMYFLLGFFLYALLYAGVGAMCNTIQDSQQFNFPLMMGLVLPMLLLSLVVEAPDSPLSIGLSLFPLFAPVLMFMRVCLQTPPAWQIGLSWLLLLLSIWLAARAAGKLFRLGVLMYGASPTWATLVRALRQP